MDLFARVFVKLLNYTYGRRKQQALLDANPMNDAVLREYEERVEAEKNERVVKEFQSSAAPVQGAVDYGELSWRTFRRVVETSEQFTFYSERNIAKVIEKSQFTSSRELETFRRTARRYVADCKIE